MSHMEECNYLNSSQLRSQSKSKSGIWGKVTAIIKKLLENTHFPGAICIVIQASPCELRDGERIDSLCERTGWSRKGPRARTV